MLPYMYQVLNTIIPIVPLFAEPLATTWPTKFHPAIPTTAQNVFQQPLLLYNPPTKINSHGFNPKDISPVPKSFKSTYKPELFPKNEFNFPSKLLKPSNRPLLYLPILVISVYYLQRYRQLTQTLTLSTSPRDGIVILSREYVDEYKSALKINEWYDSVAKQTPQTPYYTTSV